jgi:hypothetical protein
MGGHGRPCAAMTRPRLAMVGHGWSLPATHPTRCTRDDFPRRVYMSIVPVQFTHIRNVFQVSSLFTSQLVLKLCLEYNSLFVRTNEKPPYIYIYIHIWVTHTYISLCARMYMYLFGSSWIPFIASCIVVQCTSSITAPQKAPPVLPPAEQALLPRPEEQAPHPAACASLERRQLLCDKYELRKRLVLISWCIIVQASVEWHEEKYRRLRRVARLGWRAA